MSGSAEGAASFDLIEHSNAAHARTVLVDWMLGNACNFACSYCPAALHDGSIRWQDPDAALDLCRQLARHYADARGKDVWLQFTGGEPTMHPHIVRLLEQASGLGFSVSLISNASRTLRFWRKISDFLDAAILTYHNEFAELDHLIAVGNILTERMNVHVNATMHPDRFDRALHEVRSIRAKLPGATISLKPLRVDFGDVLYGYTKAQRRIMADGLPTSVPHGGATPRATMTCTDASGRCETLRANQFVLRGLNRWQGYRCNIGIESLRVRGDGTVSRAVCGVGGDIGRLGGAVTLPAAPIVCTAPSCACIADILVTKARLG